MNLFEIKLASKLSAKNKKYKLIETINISENNISVIQKTKEPDGTPYNFERIYIDFNIPESTVTTTGRVFINDSRIAYLSGLLSAGTTRYAETEAIISNGRMSSWFRLPTAIKENVSNVQKYSEEFENVPESFSKLEIKTENVNFPVGTIINIYAVRK